jgi:hypothetical protein
MHLRVNAGLEEKIDLNLMFALSRALWRASGLMVEVDETAMVYEETGC